MMEKKNLSMYVKALDLQESIHLSWLLIILVYSNRWDQVQLQHKNYGF